jgi:hypothetical protein
MKVVKKAAFWEKRVTCYGCKAVLDIEEEDLTIRWTGQDWGWDSRERTIGVICAECGDFIKVGELQFGHHRFWDIAEKNAKAEIDNDKNMEIVCKK